jgi:hypothetical protein
VVGADDEWMNRDMDMVGRRGDGRHGWIEYITRLWV